MTIWSDDGSEYGYDTEEWDTFPDETKDEVRRDAYRQAKIEEAEARARWEAGDRDPHG